MASKHRQVGAQIVRLDETNRSIYIKTVSVMLSKKLCVFEKKGVILRIPANLETPPSIAGQIQFPKVRNRTQIYCLEDSSAIL